MVLKQIFGIRNNRFSIIRIFIWPYSLQISLISLYLYLFISFTRFIEVHSKYDSKSEAIEFFIQPSADFVTRICCIFPSPNLFVECNVDVGPKVSLGSPWTSWRDVVPYQVRIPLLGTKIIKLFTFAILNAIFNKQK